jgi:hypothetical protein
LQLRLPMPDCRSLDTRETSLICANSSSLSRLTGLGQPQQQVNRFGATVRDGGVPAAVMTKPEAIPRGRDTDRLQPFLSGEAGAFDCSRIKMQVPHYFCLLFGGSGYYVCQLSTLGRARDAIAWIAGWEPQVNLGPQSRRRMGCGEQPGWTRDRAGAPVAVGYGAPCAVVLQPCTRLSAAAGRARRLHGGRAALGPVQEQVSRDVVQCGAMAALGSIQPPYLILDEPLGMPDGSTKTSDMIAARECKRVSRPL